METPIRKHHNLLPKMFKVFTLYFVITLSVFFGYVQLFGDVKPNVITIPTEDADAENDTLFGKFVENIANFENIDTDFNLSFSNSDISLSAQGNVVVDTSTSNISLDVDFIYNQQHFDVQATYVNPNIYLSINESTYKFSTEGDFDLSGLIDFVSQNIEIDASFLDEIESFLGIDFDNLDPNALLTKLKIEESQNDETQEITFVIGLGNVISAKLVCDNEFNIKSVSLKDALIFGNSIKFSANVNKMNKDDVTVDYMENGSEIDMTGINLYTTYASNLFANDFVVANATVSVDGKEYLANVYIDSLDPLKVKIDTNIEGIDLSLAYCDETVYIDVENLKFSFDVKDYTTWADTINQILEKYTSNTISDFVEELLSKYVGIELGNVDTQQVLKDVLAGIFSNVELISDYLPSSTNLSENKFELMWNNGLDVSLESNEEYLSKVAVKYQNLSLNVDFEIAENGFDIVGEYYDLSNLLPLTSIIDQILGTKQLGGEVVADVNGNEYKANILVDFSDGILAEIQTDIFGENISIYLNNNQILLCVGEIVVEGDINDLENYIARIDEIFGTDFAQKFKGDNNSFDIQNIVSELSKVLNELSIVEAENKVALIEYLTNKFYIAVENNNAILTLINEDFDIEMKLHSTSENIVLPNNTDSADDILSKIENVKNYVELKQYAFEFAVDFNNNNISGEAKIDLLNNIFDVTIDSIGGNALKVRYENNTTFVYYGTLKVKLATENVGEIFSIIQNIVAANGVEGKINISDLMTEIFGEDVSNLTLTDLLSMANVELAGSFDNLEFKAVLNSQKQVSVSGKIDFVENMIDAINVSLDGKVGIGLKVIPFELDEIAEESYYNITSVSTGKVVVSYKNGEEVVNIIANVEIDLTDKLYLHATATLFNEKIELTVLNNMLYLKIGELSFATDFNNAKELYDYVVELFNIVLPEIDISTAFAKFDLNFANIFDIEGLSIACDGTVLSADYQANDKFGISFNLKDEQILDAITVPEEYEDLKSLLPKIKSLIDYVNNGVYEFDFSVAYNSLNFDGTFKYFENNFEISNMIVCGENVYVRMQDNVLYFAFGNMKFKFDVNSIGGSSVNIGELINQISSDTLGVELNLGVFEELLEIVRTYNVQDYLTKFVLDISGNSNSIDLKLGDKKEYSISQILSASILFEQDKLKNVSVDLYGLLSAEIDVNYVENSTMTEFNPDDYKDYSENVVDGILDSFKVSDDTYAFSSDIAIRYSNNQFYGELVAMLVESENGIIGNYMPAVSLYTTSLDFSTYVYLIGKNVYIDINGLQVTADLSETTINEIISFVEQKFGLSLSGDAETLETATEMFKIVLPAIDSIYGSWISGDLGNGIQININSDLWYKENSRFYDIVLQAFVENVGDIIVPTEIVLGANIEDPNTIVYDDYSEYWLKNGDVVLENDATKDLNFAVYFNDITVGNYVQNLGETFVSDSGFDNIVAVKSNYGTSYLTEFNPYSTVLDAVGTIYDFALSYKYGVDITGTIASNDSLIEISRGDIYFEVGDIPEGQSNKFEFIEGKSLNVQAGLTIVNNGSPVSVDLMYESLKSNDIYFTYALSDTNKFRAKINDSNLEDIFKVVQKLLGSQDDSLQDSISKIDQILSSITNITKIIKEIKLSTDDSNQTILQIKLDIEGNGNVGVVRLVLGKDENNISKVDRISISNLTVSGNVIDLEIIVNDSRNDAFDYLAENPAEEHIDFSGANELINAVVNTSELNYYEIDGSLNINGNLIGIDINWNVPVNIKIKLDENRMPEVMAVIGEIPAVVGVNNDVPYEFGDTESGSGRMLYIYYKDGYVYFYRTEYVDIMFGASKRQYEKKLKVSIEEVLNDPLKYVQYGIGFTDSIISAIQASLDLAKGHTPNLGEVVKSFDAKDSQNFSVVLNMTEITNDPKLDTMTIGLSVVNNEATGYKNYIGKASLNMYMPLASVFDMTLSSDNLVLKDIGKELDFSQLYDYINSYTYNEGAQWQASNGSWSLAGEISYKISFEENGGSECADIVSPAGVQINLPTYNENLVVNDVQNGIKYVYKFDSWYTTSTFDSDTKFTSNIMPRSNTILYAKWNLIKTIETRYYTLNFNVNGGNETYNSISVAENSVVDLNGYVPTKNTYYVDKGYNWVGSNTGKWTYEVTRYTFAGWYTDISCTQKFNGTMPSGDLTLYAKWDATTTTEYYYNWERP